MKRAEKGVVMRPRNKCVHGESFPVASFMDYEKNEAFLLYMCPECGARTLLVGSVLESTE